MLFLTSWSSGSSSSCGAFSAKRKRAEAETLENLMFANASLKVSFKRVNASNAVCASLTAFKRFFNSSREYSKQR